MTQKPNSSSFSENPVPEGDNILPEYQKMAGKETREGANVSSQNDLLKNAAKADKINDANKSIDQSIEGTPQGYSPPENVNPDVLVQWVLKESYLQTREDLKKYAEKIKPEHETDPSSGDGKIPDVSGIGTVAGKDDGFIITEAGMLLESDHEKSKNLLKNILNKLAMLEKSVKTKLSDKQAETSRKKIAVALGVLVIVSTIAVAAVFGQSRGNQNKQLPSPDPVEANDPVNDPGNGLGNNPENSLGNNPGKNPVDIIVVTQTIPACDINFTNPINTADIPNFGPVLFEWTSVPGAISYGLKVTPPAISGLPWIYSVTETSKNIYMENFPMGGIFQVSVDALSSNKKVLCTTALRFNKGELAQEELTKKKKEQGNNNNEPVSTPCTSTGIGYFCP